MTDYRYKFFKNIDYRYRLTKSHYYDIDVTRCDDEDYTATPTFSAYTGLTATFMQGPNSIPVITIQGGVMPDYSVYRGTYGCLAPSGNNYLAKVCDAGNKDMIVNSGCTISSAGVATGFGSANKIAYPYPFPATISKLKIIIKATLTDLTACSAIFGHHDTDKAYIGVSDSGVYGLYDGTAWKNGTTVLQSNTAYWFGIGFDGETCTGYLLADDGTYTIKTVPDFSIWSAEWSYSGDIFSQYLFDFGACYNATSDYMKGSIDLSASRIVVNGEVFFEWENWQTAYVKGILADGATDNAAARTYNLFYDTKMLLDTDSARSGATWVGQISAPMHTTYPRYLKTNSWSVVGRLEFDGTWVRGFSPTDYLLTNYTFLPPANASWVIQAKFMSDKTDSGSIQSIFGGNMNLGSTYCNITAAGKMQTYVVSNGSSLCGCRTTDALTSGQVYWVRVERLLYAESEFFTPSWTFRTLLSTDGYTWDTVAFYTTEVDPVVATEFLRFGCTTYNARYLKGAIDLAETFVEINGVRVWEGIHQVTA